MDGFLLVLSCVGLISYNVWDIWHFIPLTNGFGTIQTLNMVVTISLYYRYSIWFLPSCFFLIAVMHFVIKYVLDQVRKYSPLPAINNSIKVSSILRLLCRILVCIVHWIDVGLKVKTLFWFYCFRLILLSFRTAIMFAIKFSS